MEEQSFSFEQARSICSMYRHLVGTSFQTGSTQWLPIECVAISPHDDINKWLFVSFYQDTKDQVKALSFYKPPYYDVIVIARSARNVSELTFEDLRSFLVRTMMPADRAFTNASYFNTYLAL